MGSANDDTAETTLEKMPRIPLAPSTSAPCASPTRKANSSAKFPKIRASPGEDCSRTPSGSPPPPFPRDANRHAHLVVVVDRDRRSQRIARGGNARLDGHLQRAHLADGPVLKRHHREAQPVFDVVALQREREGELGREREHFAPLADGLGHALGDVHVAYLALFRLPAAHVHAREENLAKGPDDAVRAG